jgi:hypothetical protein
VTILIAAALPFLSAKVCLFGKRRRFYVNFNDVHSVFA